MADKRISQLIERTNIANNDVLPIVASGATTTNKVTISSIQTFMQSNLDVGVTSVGITLGSSGTDVSVSGSPITSSGNITINLPTASATNRGLLSAANWSTFNSKQQAITLTTTGTSGAATLVSGTLNIPNYSTDLSGYVTLGTTQTITAQKTFTTSGSSDTMIISHGSGSGFALDVLKAGNGEAIRVTKTSGSGNAMTISGGNFEAGTIVKTGGTSSQFLKADGSVDSSTYVTTDTNQSITGFKSFVNGFSLASEGGTNQPTTFINTGSIHEGSASTNQIGFNNSNNIYFGKGLNNGGVLQWTNAAVRYYTLPDADGTIALTTDLSGYLPLTGGTLSNNLFITGGGLQVSGSASANRQVVELYTSSTVSRLAASYVGSSSYGDLELLTGGLARLTISAAGASTFSGALNGTSASFTGNVGIGGSITSLSDSDELSFFAGTTISDNRSRIELYGPSHATLPNQTFIRGSQITFTSSSAATEYMRFASTGAATFSSSVTSVGLISSSTVRPSSNYAADLGTSSVRWADIFGASLNVQTTSTAANVITIINATQRLDLGVNDAAGGSFIFASPNKALRFGANDEEKMRLTSDGYQRMASGTLGIQFNGDTAAANALDDYEEGTWTPTLPNGGTLTVLNARYVKIGQKVTVSFYIQLVSPTNNSSDFLIGGLPFANAGYSTFYTAGSFGYVDTANFSGWAPITGLNFGYIYFHAIDGTSSARKTNANYLTVAGGSNQIILTITYFAAT